LSASKFSHASLDADKRYRATLRLGVTTTTGDCEGALVDERPVQVDRTTIVAACARFLGAGWQTPPMHSALKHNGRALYEYARDGVDVPRAPRPVTVHAVDVVGYDGTTLELDITCGKGTYIRTLAEDLGLALGCGAYLSALRRTAVGGFGVEQAVTLEALQARSEAQRDELVRVVDCLLAEQPAIRLNDSEAARFLTGLRRRVDLRDAPIVRVYGPPPQDTTGGVDADVFLGSAHVAGGELIAGRLLSPLEVGAAFPAPGAPSPRIEESESLPS